jgi:hypothetical protein
MMNDFSDLALILISVDAILLAIISILLFFSKAIPRDKKIYQLVFSIIIPILGPLMVFLVYLSDRIRSQKPSDRYMGQSIDENPYRQEHLP